MINNDCMYDIHIYQYCLSVSLKILAYLNCLRVIIQ